MLRVVSGSARGTHLKTLETMDTRPTADRVKESLFNILYQVRGLQVLDLFSGTGNLGIEALSRGAASVDFCESNTECIALIRENLKKCRMTDTGKIAHKDVFAFLETLKGKRYDLVLMDPPYFKEYVPKVLERIDHYGIISLDGRIVAETDSSEALPERVGGLVQTDLRKYGRTQLVFYTCKN